VIKDLVIVCINCVTSFRVGLSKQLSDHSKLLSIVEIWHWKQRCASL